MRLPLEEIELSESERSMLRTYLGEERFGWYESMGNPDTVRQAWLQSMAEQARTEPPSTIRMPLYTNTGWGCSVPSKWVATGSFNPDVTFIKPVGDTAEVERCERCFELEDFDARDRCKEQRCQLAVEGHFTGKIIEEQHCDEFLHEFHLARASTKARASLFLALPGGAAPPEGPPITGGPRWGVLFANTFRYDTNARSRAEALRTRLIEQGFAKAKVFDSRRIKPLWCCSYTVLVDRFDDQAMAQALGKQLERKGFSGILVRALY